MREVKFQIQHLSTENPDTLLKNYDIAIVTVDDESMFDWRGDGNRSNCWIIKMYARTNRSSFPHGMYYLSQKNEFTNLEGCVAKTFDSYVEAVSFLKHAGSIPVRSWKYDLQEIE